MQNIGLILFALFGFMFISCGSDVVQVPTKTKTDTTYLENQIKQSKKHALYEKRAIDTLLQIKGWDMEVTPSGLRKQITHEIKCDGLTPKKGDYLDIEIEILDIFEKVIYKKQLQTIHFRKEVIENGLDEALSEMCVGSKAKLILPSHLAFGKRGLNKDVGVNQVLIYYVELVNKK
ncbi:MAG: FKBP-type peptidyl-prolyl cis-trans isomerase [Flavobacteriales bacterium]